MRVTTRHAKPLRARAPGTSVSHPIVLRFSGLTPATLHRFVMHDRRRGGDLSHVNGAASPGNRIEHGETNWADELKQRIAELRRSNHQEELRALRAKHRKKDAKTVQQAGPSDPWRASTEGPLREGILTAHKSWFGGSGNSEWDKDRVEKFRLRAMEFLRTHFPDGQLIYASSHADEEAFHIHFVVAVWTEKLSANRGSQMLLQPSANPLLADYEHAQNLAGAAFLELGLRRGERRAESRRRARAEGTPVPAERGHVPPSQWRAEERRKGRSVADQLIADAKATAENVAASARPDAEKMVRKTRKRALKEARRRRTEAERREATARRKVGEAAEKLSMSETNLRKTEMRIVKAQSQLTTLERKADEIVAKADRAYQRHLEARAQHQAEEREATRIRTGLVAKVQAANARVDASMARYQALELGLKLVRHDQLRWEAARPGEPRQLLWGPRGSTPRPLPLLLLNKLEPAKSILEILLELIRQLLEALFGEQHLAIETDAKVIKAARVELGLEPDMTIEDLLARRFGMTGPEL